MLTEERVREIREALWQGTGRDANDRDVDDLAADWLALRQQNAALRAMVGEAVAGWMKYGYVDGSDEEHAAIDALSARLAALGET